MGSGVPRRNLQHYRANQTRFRGWERRPVRCRLVRNRPLRGTPVRNRPLRGRLVRGRLVRGRLVRGRPVRNRPVRGRWLREYRCCWVETGASARTCARNY
jgi:hypothetical protein